MQCVPPIPQNGRALTIDLTPQPWLPVAAPGRIEPVVWASTGRRPAGRRRPSSHPIGRCTRGGDRGIPATGRLRVRGAGAEPGHRHLRRRQRVLQGVGRHRCGRGDAPRGHLPRRRPDALRFRRHLLWWPGRGYSGAGAQEPPRPRAHFHQRHLPHRPRPQRCRFIALPPHSCRRGQPAPARHRPHRPVPAARFRCPHTHPGGAAHARRPGARTARFCTSAARTSRAGT